MIQIASFSSGASSAIMTERLLQKYGANNVLIVFMDTLMEHKDNYRFFRDMEKRWQDVYGIEKIEVLCFGMSPYELADKKNMIFNTRIAPCTTTLKIEPFMKFISALPYGKENMIINIGIDYEEIHRCKAIEKNYGKAGYTVDFPLLWKPLEYRPYSQVCRDDFGIEPPITYSMGFSHANCLGADKYGRGGCVKLGVGERKLQYQHMPEIAEATARWELTNPGHKKGHAMLNRNVNGKRTYVSLDQVLSEHKQQEAVRVGLSDIFPSFDEDMACLHCGIADFDPDSSGTSE